MIAVSAERFFIVIDIVQIHFSRLGIGIEFIVLLKRYIGSVSSAVSSVSSN